MKQNDLTSVVFDINNAWSMLSGSSLDFQMITGKVVPDSDAYHFAIPIRFSEDDELAAVALEISRSNALAVSAALYQMSEKELSEHEVNDVCSELCNVLSACVCNYFSRDKEANLNLPQKLSAEDFLYVFNGSNLDRYFKAVNQDGSIVIYMFDPCNYERFLESSDR